MKVCRGFVVLAALLASATVAGSTAPGPVPAGDFHGPLWRRAQELAASGRPLELLVASRLAFSQEPSTPPRAAGEPAPSDEWLERAIRTGSDQPVIARAAVSRCIATGRCDIPAAIQTLRTREADDAVSQLLLWRMEMVRGSPATMALAWERVANATRFVDEYAEGVALFDRMTRGVRLPAPDDGPSAAPDLPRLEVVYGLSAGLSMTALADLHRRCRAGAADAVLDEGCRHLLTVMADSASLLANSFATSKLLAAARDAAERARWQERRRELAWITTEASGLLGADSDVVPGVDTHAYLRWTVESGELGAMRQLLAANGIPVQPPAGWQPPQVP